MQRENSIWVAWKLRWSNKSAWSLSIGSDWQGKNHQCHVCMSLCVCVSSVNPFFLFCLVEFPFHSSHLSHFWWKSKYILMVALCGYNTLAHHKYRKGPARHALHAYIMIVMMIIIRFCDHLRKYETIMTCIYNCSIS